MDSLLVLGKIADCAIIATPDREHYQQTLAVAKLGYHILLEKPMAVSEEQCQEIVDVMGKDQILAICHVLR